MIRILGIAQKGYFRFEGRAYLAISMFETRGYVKEINVVETGGTRLEICFYHPSLVSQILCSCMVRFSRCLVGDGEMGCFEALIILETGIEAAFEDAADNEGAFGGEGCHAGLEHLVDFVHETG